MAKPSEFGQKQLKKTARYLVGVRRAVHHFRIRPDMPSELVAWADSDWAGDKTTRKSTSGGILVVGDSMIKSWSSTQATQALSVGEAEYYAVIKACAEAIGLQSIARDLGWVFRVVIRSDSSTAKSIGSRQGLGKLRHLETKYLWLQGKLRRGQLRAEGQ